jgi:uncharacterized protein (TIGR02466 family)
LRRLPQAQSGSLFATPILSHYWAENGPLNTQLREAIFAHERRDRGTTLTNAGGWHSAPGMLEFCGAAGRELIGQMQAMIGEATARLFAEFDRPAPSAEWVFSAWANINRAGDFNQMHTHPGATWSGVYYVDDGQSDLAAEGTAIRLSDPNPARTNIFFPELSASDITFRPQPGLMILFPSYVPHSVPPHRGDRPRLSIAFNARRDPFP